MKSKRTQLEILADARRTGRPPLPKTIRKSGVLRIRLARRQIRWVKEQARAAGVGLSEWMRRRLLEGMADGL